MDYPNIGKKVDWNTRKEIGCKQCGSLRFDKVQRDFGEGFTTVYKCKDCGYEDIEVAVR